MLMTREVERGGELLLSFEPNLPESLKLLLGGKELKFSVKGNLVSAEVPFNLRAGKHELKVLYGGREKTFEVKILGGLEEEELLL